MSDFTVAYTELVDKVIRDGVLNAHQHDQDHDAHDENPITEAATRTSDDGGFSDIFVAKATAMSVLFIAALCAGLIPFKLAQIFKWKRGGTETGRTGLIVSLLLAFGGGVLLCTTFLHLLPEVKENIERLQAAGALPRVGFHLAEFLMCTGFFLMYLIEQCVHTYLHGRDARRLREDDDSMAFRRGVSVRESASVAVAVRRKRANDGSAEQRNGNNGALGTSSVAELIENDANNDASNNGVVGGMVNGGLVNGSAPYLTAVVDIAPKAEPLSATNNGTTGGSNNGHHHHHHHRHHHHHHHNNGGTQPNGHHGHGHSHLHLPIAAPSLSAGKNGPAADGHNHADGAADDAVVTSLRGLLIVLALSVHELFEGLAVGLESSAQNVWYLFGAVAAHKLVLAFCVGVELIVARTRKWLAFGYVLTFSVVSPLGIGIGILVSGESSGGGGGGGVSNGGSVVSAVLQGLACGTLLYVVFFEILQKDKSGLVQLVAVLVGFFIMFGIQFMSGHEHTHGDGGHDSGHSHGHGHSHEHGNPHADDDHANHAMVGRLDAAEPFDTHDQQQTTTTTTTELQRALPQLVEELAGAVLTQTRQLQQQ